MDPHPNTGDQIITDHRDPDPTWQFLCPLKIFFLQNGSKLNIFNFLIILNSFAEIFPTLMKY
jgi:hypothetical protein